MPTNTSNGLDLARSRKSKKSEYFFLIGDLENLGWTTQYDTMEMPLVIFHNLPVWQLLITLPTFFMLYWKLQGLHSPAHTKCFWHTNNHADRAQDFCSVHITIDINLYYYNLFISSSSSTFLINDCCCFNHSCHATISVQFMFK